MHKIVFRVGAGAGVAVVLLMLSSELLASLSLVSREAIAPIVRLTGRYLLFAAVLAGLFLLPESWRRFRRKRASMSPEVRHVWLLIMIFGLSIAGYAGYIYLGDSKKKE